ncbi:prepilin peptidase [Candidatus Pacearchaeota archaeon]|nr:prepilin peptidase [Candidatus Pacearchaeota archaeon]
MLQVMFLVVLALIWIIFASIQDLKKREVANWISFSLIIFALAFRFFYSLFFGANYGFAFFYQGLIGLGIFIILGNLFYYGRIFAGGDAKLMMAMGAILPFSESFYTNLKIFILFFVIFFFVGAFYGFIISIILSLKNFKKFRKEFSKQITKNKKIVCLLMVVGIIFMVLGFIECILFIVGIFIFILPYFYIYAKSVEESCMVKKIKTIQLAEGDWLCHGLKIGRKFIKPTWNGVSKEEIRIIKKKYKETKIKQGIPFVPVFLISFAILVLLYFLKIELWNLFEIFGF